MSLLKDFATAWGMKVEGERIPGPNGFIMEHQGQLWVWTFMRKRGLAK